MVIRQIFRKCTRVQMSAESNNRGNSMAIIRLIPCTMHHHWRASAMHHSWECRLLSPHFLSLNDEGGTAVAQWLRCCATNRKVTGSIPDGVNGIFH